MPGPLPSNPDQGDSPEEIDSAVEELAGKVVERGLETPAIMFLEMHKPLASLGSQAILVAGPLLMPLFGAEGVRRYTTLFGSPDKVETLIRRIEDLSNARRGERRSK